MFFFDLFFSLVGLLLSVAFLTLVERKFMGYRQFRKGPSKVFFSGLFQPFSDAIKLFSKGFVYQKFSKFYFFSFGPVLGCNLMMLLWLFFPSLVGLFGWRFELLLFFSIISLISYFLFFCGFRVVSIYSVIGYVRSVSQVISYEVCVMVVVMFIVYSFSSLSFFSSRFWGLGVNYLFFLPFLLFVWFIVSLSESNRSPFDFSEGESELVSGFNVEYFGGLFSIIFVVEYGIIIFMSYIGSWLLVGSLTLFFSVFLFSLVYLWSRRSFPRYRYDKLMEICWLRAAPLIVGVLLILSEFFFNA